MKKIIILIMSVAAFPAIYLVSPAFGIIFLMLWIDKIILRTVTPSAFGIELVTISTVLAGIAHGPIAGVAVIFLIPMLEGVKYIIIPTNQEWPPFVPSPYNLIDGLVVTVAWLLQSEQLLVIVALALAIKLLINATIDTFIMQKPFNIISAVTSAAFNIFLVVSFGGWFEGLATG